MSSIPYSSLNYNRKELSTTPLKAYLKTLKKCYEESKEIKATHLKPLEIELTLLEKFLVRNGVALRHEKGIRLVKRVFQCLKRVLRRKEADVIKGLEIISHDVIEELNADTRMLPSRQTLQHFLASLLRVLDLFSVTIAHSFNAYSYLSQLLTLGHLVPCFLSFAASVSRVAVLIHGLSLRFQIWFNSLRPLADHPKGSDADLRAYEMSELPASYQLEPNAFSFAVAPDLMIVSPDLKSSQSCLQSDVEDEVLGSQSNSTEDVGEIITRKENDSFSLKKLKKKKRKLKEKITRNAKDEKNFSFNKKSFLQSKVFGHDLGNGLNPIEEEIITKKENNSSSGPRRLKKKKRKFEEKLRSEQKDTSIQEPRLFCDVSKKSHKTGVEKCEPPARDEMNVSLSNKKSCLQFKVEGLELVDDLNSIEEIVTKKENVNLTPKKLKKKKRKLVEKLTSDQTDTPIQIFVTSYVENKMLKTEVDKSKEEIKVSLSQKKEQEIPRPNPKTRTLRFDEIDDIFGDIL